MYYIGRFCLWSFCFLGEELERKEPHHGPLRSFHSHTEEASLTDLYSPFLLGGVISLTLLQVIPLMYYCDQEKMNSPLCVHCD